MFDCVNCFFFFKQKTAYEMRISDWSSDVCSSDLPEFSGNVLHTSGVLEIAEHKAIKIAETRNNFYALLGPELVMPADCGMDPGAYLEMHQYVSPVLDMRASAAMTADPDCPKCNATGVYQHSDRRLALCDLCCKHNRGWWQLEGAYGKDNGRWACKAGCGLILDTPPLELEFLPRTVDQRPEGFRASGRPKGIAASGLHEHLGGP